jgi:hypothetical protein
MNMKKSLLMVAVSAAFAVAAPFAAADTVGETADAPIVVAQVAPQQGAAQGQAARPQFRLPSERTEARLTQAKSALKITDAQNTLWENFAGVLRNQARAMDTRFQQRRAAWEAARAQGTDPKAQKPQQPTVSAIERLERSQQRLADRQARLNEVVAAAKPLYAALSPEQKQIADGMLAQHGQGGHRHKHHHRGMQRGA